MQIFIELGRHTVKKSDVKRMEVSHNGKALYVYVSGMKDPICFQTGGHVKTEEKRADLLTLLGA